MNDCIGDEISHLKVVKLPYTGQENLAAYPLSAATIERNEELLRRTAREMLKDYMMTHERKNEATLRKYRKQHQQRMGQMDKGSDIEGPHQEYVYEVNFYLDEHNYDYVSARDAYEEDLECELELARAYE